MPLIQKHLCGLEPIINCCKVETTCFNELRDKISCKLYSCDLTQLLLHHYNYLI